MSNDICYLCPFFDIFSYQPNVGITNRFPTECIQRYKEDKIVVYIQVSNVSYFPPHPALIQADIMRAVGGTYTADSVSWEYITPTQAYTLFHINDIAID